MRRYKINGTKDNEKHYCPTCKAGKLFFGEQIYKTDKLGNDHREHICGVCNTKYKQSFIDMPFEIDSLKGVRLTQEKYKEWAQSYGSSHLDLDNEPYHLVMIGENIKKVIKMENLGELKEKFEQTGKCEKHELKMSHPFRTAEGTFYVECCPVCLMAKLKYKGTTYYDSISSLVRYVAQMGIAYGKQVEAQEQKLDGLFDIEVIKDAELSVSELPSYSEMKEEPSFELEEPVW